MVDNNGTGEIFGVLKKEYSGVTVIKNIKNMGACFARNQGIKLSHGKYIMFMDSDAYLENNFFANLKTVLDKLPSNIGAISPKILKADSNRIFSCGLKISPIYRAYDYGKSRNALDFSNSFLLDGPNSCCAIFKRECLEDIRDSRGQYFDNDFFFLFEDADLALRLKNKGWRSIFMPGLICYHYGGSSGIDKNFRRFLCFRNRWYMVLKTRTGKDFFIFLLKSFFYDFFRTIYFFITNNKYFFITYKDIYKKIKDGKNTNI